MTTEKQIQILTEAVKDTVKEMAKAGYTGTQIATAISRKFGNGFARLIMSDLAIDLGMTEKTKRYLARF
jgi:hypothetical protein